MSAKKSKEAAAETKGPKKVPTPRLMERYFKEIVPALSAKLGRNNILSLPRLKKIVINMGVGKAITEKKFIEEARKRADESARKWHGNKRLSQHRQLEAIKEPKNATGRS